MYYRLASPGIRGTRTWCLPAPDCKSAGGHGSNSLKFQRHPDELILVQVDRFLDLVRLPLIRRSQFDFVPSGAVVGLHNPMYAGSVRKLAWHKGQLPGKLADSGPAICSYRQLTGGGT